jgi:hypothetical protein
VREDPIGIRARARPDRVGAAVGVGESPFQGPLVFGIGGDALFLDLELGFDRSDPRLELRGPPGQRG